MINTINEFRCKYFCKYQIHRVKFLEFKIVEHITGNEKISHLIRCIDCHADLTKYLGVIQWATNIVYILDCSRMGMANPEFTVYENWRENYGIQGHDLEVRS